MLVPSDRLAYEVDSQDLPFVAPAVISPGQVEGNHDEGRVIGFLFNDEDRR